MDFKVKIKSNKSVGDGEFFSIPLVFEEISEKLGISIEKLDDGEGYKITDYDCPFPLEEEENLDEVNAMYDEFEDLPLVLKENFKELLDFESAEEIFANGGSNFSTIEAGNEQEFGEETVAEIGIEGLSRENLEMYFDYESFGRDCEIESSGFYGNGGYIEYTN